MTRSGPTRRGPAARRIDRNADPDRDPNLPILVAFLARNDAPCPACGYNLRGLTGDVCPECGQPFELRIGTPTLPTLEFMVFLAPMVIAALFALALVVLLFAQPPSSPTGPKMFHVFIASGGIQSVLAYLSSQKRRDFYNAHSDLRIACIVLAWLLNAIIFAIFLLTV